MGQALYLFVAMLLAFPSAAQSYMLSGQIIDSETNTGLQGVTVLLKSGAAVVSGCGTDQNGRFQLVNEFAKDYSIEVKCLGYRSKTVRFVGSAANPASLRILMPGFCPYAYTRGRTPPCIGGHTDQIVPIAYGLPFAKTMKKAKKGKVHLGGCKVSGCDPQYYCLLHKREL